VLTIMDFIPTAKRIVEDVLGERIGEQALIVNDLGCPMTITI